MANEVNRRELARVGALARLAQIEAEAAAIRAAFPGLGSETAQQPAKRRTAKPAGRRELSHEERKAVSERMKRYLAERRQAKFQAQGPAVAHAEISEAATAKPASRRRTAKRKAKPVRAAKR